MGSCCGKQEKVAFVPCQGSKGCRFIPGIPYQTLNMTNGVSFAFLSSNVPKMRTLGSFFGQTVTMETTTVTKILTSVLDMYFQVV